LTHAPGAVGIFEGVVERKQSDVLRARDLRDQLVEPPDLRLSAGPAVVPGQEVDEENPEPQLLATPHHRAQVVCGVSVRAALGDQGDQFAFPGAEGVQWIVAAAGRHQENAELTAFACLMMLERVNFVITTEVQLPEDMMSDKIADIMFAAFGLIVP